VFRFGSSLLIVLFLAACSTPQISLPPKANLKLVNEYIRVNVTGSIADTDLLDRLTREIKAQLIVAGFDIETQTDKKLVLNVHVSEFDPGNTALRLTVGFGVGRGSLIYSAEYSECGRKSPCKDGRPGTFYRRRERL